MYQCIYSYVCARVGVKCETIIPFEEGEFQIGKTVGNAFETFVFVICSCYSDCQGSKKVTGPGSGALSHG